MYIKLILVVKEIKAPTNIPRFNNSLAKNARSLVAVFVILFGLVVFLIWRLRLHLPSVSNDPTLVSTERVESMLVGLLAIILAAGSILYLLSIIRAQRMINFERLESQNSKDELLSMASHQLRTPSTAVKQYLGMVLEGYAGKFTKEQMHILKQAYFSNERQLETINQILYITKANAGRLELQKSYFNLNQLVEEVITELSTVVKERHQKLSFKPRYVNLPIHADRHCIMMVIENLLSNASKYTHRGGSITINTDRSDNIAVLSIIDNGVGIKFEDRSKLFKRFSRLDNELSIQAGGSGLGLFLGRILVEMHGGHIRVISEPKKGSTFTVQLPTQTNKIRLNPALLK